MVVEPELPSVYVETSVVSYLTALSSRDAVVLGHQEITRRWWQAADDEYRLYTSQMVVDEASRGDRALATLRLKALSGLALLTPHDSLLELAQAIYAALGLPTRATADAVHLAYAVHFSLDYLVTWNCAHLANAATLRRLVDFTQRNGLWLPIVCTPEEVMPDSEDDDVA